MSTRRTFLESMVALVAAPAGAGFLPSQIAQAINPQRYISVLDFGADPTGDTDSRAAIGRALKAAGVGGTIYFPAGRYRCGPIVACYPHNISGGTP